MVTFIRMDESQRKGHFQVQSESLYFLVHYAPTTGGAQLTWSSQQFAHLALTFLATSLIRIKK